MLSDATKARLNELKSLLRMVDILPQYDKFRRQDVFLNAWYPAMQSGLIWLEKVLVCEDRIQEEAGQQLQEFLQQLIAISDQPTRQTINAVAAARNSFVQNLPLLAFYILDASGTMDLTQGTVVAWGTEARRDIEGTAERVHGELQSTSAQLIGNIRLSAEEAVRDFEFAKADASKISVENAQKQFLEAEQRLKSNARWWGVATTTSLLGLAGLLFFLLRNPPTLISAVIASMAPGSKTQMSQVSVPLLIAASAYFTSLRFAMVGALGIAFAFSIRMFRAYLHMLEHNAHKLRITNSIEAFVAAVRTKEQKDLVLSKLVESVTEFGDSGILGKSSESNGLPSVIFEAMTKNVGKSD